MFGYQKKSWLISKLPYFHQQCNPVITDKETNLISRFTLRGIRLLRNPETVTAVLYLGHMTTTEQTPSTDKGSKMQLKTPEKAG